MYTEIPNRYLISATFQKRALDFSFPAEVWGVAAALSEQRRATSTYELESLTGLGSGQVREAIERLLAEDLVREHLMSWKDFSAARKRDPNGFRPAAAPARPAPAQPPVQSLPYAEAAVREERLPSHNPVSMRLGSITAQPGVSSTSAWIAQRPDPAQVASFQPSPGGGGAESDQENGRLLRPMLEQIERIKGGGVEGQLLVYQVFLRVPHDLLSAEGIKSLHFVDGQTRIRNPQLIAAIVKAAKDVIGIDLA